MPPFGISQSYIHTKLYVNTHAHAKAKCLLTNGRHQINYGRIVVTRASAVWKLTMTRVYHSKVFTSTHTYMCVIICMYLYTYSFIFICIKSIISTMYGTDNWRISSINLNEAYTYIYTNIYIFV